jgi:hypothetical protein
VNGTVTLSQSQLDAITAGQTYILIQTSDLPNGAIRGNLRAQ